jgi:C-terminal processing protease CtpA/Prc
MAAAFAASLFGCSSVGSGNAESGAALSELQSYIDKYYYKDVSDDDLYVGRRPRMVSALGDTYAEYFTAEEYAQASRLRAVNNKGSG